MDKAVKHTAPPVGDESPDLEALLKAGSFQQRLELARIRREKALAESGRDPEKELSGLTKPWERADYTQPDKLAAPRVSPRPVAKNGPRLKGPFDGPAGLALPLSDAVLAPRAITAAEVAPVSAPKAATGFPIVRTMFGFGLGVSLGAALAWSYGQFGQQAPAQPTPIVQAVATAPTFDTAPSSTTAAAAMTEPATPTLDSPVQIAAANDQLTRLVVPVLAGSSVAPEGAPMVPDDPAPMPIAADDAPATVLIAPDAGGVDFPTINDGPQTVLSSDAPLKLAVATPADQALPAQPLPTAAIVQGISVHIFVPTSGTKLDSKALATEIGAAGYKIAETAPVSFTVKKTHVRFYHSDDEVAAESLAKTLGATARDFTGQASPPPDGHIEIWLAGMESVAETPAAAPVKTSKKVKQATPAKPALAPMPEDVQMQILRDRILSQLN